jgi:hypothetical protein
MQDVTAAAAPRATKGSGRFASAFGLNGRIDNAFFFHYVAATGQQLAVNEWKNASCNRGGDSGDIATTATSKPGTFGCP